MFFYIENTVNCPYYNLALEQTVFDRLDRRHSYCMLWRNRSAVIIGRNQNTAAEINQAFVDSRGIDVARRLSGGGAVYHDMGNINFTFITDAAETIDFAPFCALIREALQSFGVPARVSGRNDMTVDGKKISGNAQYIRQNRVMHHGTLLYDSDLDMLSRALSGSGKVESGGIRSVRSAVTNIRPYMEAGMPSDAFFGALRDRLLYTLGMREYTLTADDKAAAETLRERVYSRRDWNYGASPPCNARKRLFVEGCGTVEALLNIEKGIIAHASFYGDFFGNENPAALAAVLAGHRLEYGELAAALQGIAISRYFYNMDTEAFLQLLLG